MALDDIAGQARALEVLRGEIERGRVSHAYLFKGEKGVGKRLAAVNFAKVLNCLSTEPSSLLPNARTGSGERGREDRIDCCEGCTSCRKINREAHPDVFFISPDNGQIKIDAIRRLEEALSYKAFEGRWKIAIIHDAEKLNPSAANAFLKTLEEPPGQSVIIVISSAPELVPLTIRSRCHSVNFTPLPRRDMEALLEHKQGLTGGEVHDEEARLLFLLSGGRPGQVLGSDLVSVRNRAFSEFMDVLSGDIEDGLWTDSDTMETWFDWAQLWLRDMAVYSATGSKDLLINRDKEEQIQGLSRKAELKDILKLSRTFYNIKSALRFNLNRNITLNHTCLLLKKTFGGGNA